jgi:hypothetical protein
MIDRSPTYDRLIKGIKTGYADRIVTVLNRIRETLIKAGIDCDPVIDLHTGDYRWTFNAHPPGRDR